jgi:HipA-like protein
MINWLNKLFKNEEQAGEFITPENVKIIFLLKFKDLAIGNLYYEDNKWVFEYSNDFKNQNKIDALLDFPEKNKVYNAPYLWPFFAHRIPGLGQPQVQEIIKHENINPKNEIDLLRRFGRKSITNPFELAVSA